MISEHLPSAMVGLHLVGGGLHDWSEGARLAAAWQDMDCVALMQRPIGWEITIWSWSWMWENLIKRKILGLGVSGRQHRFGIMHCWCVFLSNLLCLRWLMMLLWDPAVCKRWETSKWFCQQGTPEDNLSTASLMVAAFAASSSALLSSPAWIR